MKRCFGIVMLLLATGMMWGCGDKENHLNVDPSMLYGQWVKNGTEYYWTFNANGRGNLVNRGEVQEGDEDNGDFSWKLSNGDELELEFRGSGELGGIDITKNYTITEISSEKLRWVDVYDRETKLTKL